MRKRYVAVATAAMVGWVFWFAGAADAQGEGQVRVTDVQVDAPVYQPPSVLARDVGVSANVGGRVSWIFGDTIYNPPACDGTSYRNATAAVGTLASVQTVVEPLDTCGAPSELFTPQLPTDPDGTRVPFWPDSLVPHPNGVDTLIFYQRTRVPQGRVDAMQVEAGIVDELPATDPTHVDRTDETVLWQPGEPSFVAGAFVDADGYLYAYTWDLVHYLARVPWASYRDRSAWEFWTGTGWGSDIAAAQPVQLGGTTPDEQKGGRFGLSVAWNDYLGKYLMVHSQSWGNLQGVVLRTADRPEGPWSAPTLVDVPHSVASAEFGNYTARQHPEYASDGGQHIVVTYSRTTGWLRQELPVVRLTLAQPK